MSQVFTFISTKTTYTTTIGQNISSLGDLVRRVRNALAALSYPTRVGELRDFPLSNAVPNFLLCDGSEVEQLAFPELFAYLGDSQGTPSVASNFLLPNYVGTKAQAPVAPPQTIVGGTVSTGGTVTQPSTPAQTGGSTGGNVVSGGRTLRSSEFDPL